MKFVVGPHPYRVRISRGSLLDADQNAVAGLVVFNARTVWLSGEIPIQQRSSTLFSMLRTVHVKHYGHLDDTGLGTFITDMTRQLNAMGGEATLMRLNVDGMVDHEAGPVEQAHEPRGTECGRCATKFTEYQITSDAPTYDDRHEALLVRRSVECDHCSKTMSWHEGCTQGGVPNGRIYAGPIFSQPTSGLVLHA